MKDISIYDLDDNKKYSFISTVDEPVSHETVGIHDWKKDRVLLKDVKVLIGKEWYLLDNGGIIRIDLGKKLLKENLKEFDVLSFNGKVRYVEVNRYFDYDDRCKVRMKWGAQISPRGNLYYGYGDEYYARTLGFLTDIEKY